MSENRTRYPDYGEDALREGLRLVEAERESYTTGDGRAWPERARALDAVAAVVRRELEAPAALDGDVERGLKILAAYIHALKMSAQDPEATEKHRRIYGRDAADLRAVVRAVERERRMREALEPFAAKARETDARPHADGEVLADDEDAWVARVGDFRRARAALAAAPPAEPQSEPARAVLSPSILAPILADGLADTGVGDKWTALDEADRDIMTGIAEHIVGRLAAVPRERKGEEA